MNLRFYSAWLCGLLAASMARAAAAPYPPVSVIELLRALSATGANVLYSSDLVPASLTAPDSSPEAPPVTRASAALAANGLTLRQTGAHAYVVIRAAEQPPALPPAAAARLAAAPPAPAPRATLDEISVYASRYEFSTGNDGEPAQFNARQIEETPGSKTDSVRALHTAPGLASNLSARPYVRGAMLDDVLVVYDGIVLADPYHFRTFQSVLSVFNAATVGRADVFTGGFPVSYGTRSGGVIDLTPASRESGYEYGLSASLISYDLETKGRSDQLPLEWLLVARQSSDDRVVQKFLTHAGEPSFSDVIGRLRWTLGPTAALTAGWLFQADEMTLFDPGAQEESSRGRTHDENAWVRWEWTPAEILRGNSSVALSRTDRDSWGAIAQSGVADGSLRAERSFGTVGLRSDWTYTRSSALTWNFGGEFTHESAELYFNRNETFASSVATSFGRPTDASIISNQSPRSSSLGLYAAAHRRWNTLEAELGLRFDAQDYRGFGVRSQAAPRLNVRYDLTDSWHAYGSWGQFSQAQRVDEYRMESDQSIPDSANRAVHAVAGLMRESSDRTTWRVEAYRHHWTTINPYYDNLMGPLSLLPQLEPDRVLVSPADADASGLEVSAQHSFDGPWSAWGSYSLSRITDDTNGRDVVRSWDQTHAVNLALAWSRNDTLVSTLLSWHSGWPRTPITVYPATAVATAYLGVGTRNSARWGDYLSLDLRLSKSFAVASADLSVWLDGTNITNRSNPCCVDLDALVPTPEAEAAVWTPRAINLGFTVKIRRPK